MRRIYLAVFLMGFYLTLGSRATAANAYLTGVTFSSNFPTANALQPNFRGGAFDAFVTKVNPSGPSLVYSTYLGGTEEDRGFRIALDGAGNVYVAGLTGSSNFPLVSAMQPIFGGEVTLLSQS